MRKIRLKLLTQSQLVTLNTEAYTFAELQKEVENHPELKDVVVSGKSQFIDNATKAVYGTIPDAILPVGDCLMYVVPTQTKLGCDVPTKSAVEQMTYTELRSLGSKLNKENGATIDLSGKRVDVLERVVNWLDSLEEDDVKEPQSEEESSTEDKIVAYANKIIALVEDLKKERVALDESVAFATTYAELEAEANRLKNLFR